MRSHGGFPATGLAALAASLFLLGCYQRDRDPVIYLPAAGNQASAVALADLNADGKLELVSTTFYTGALADSPGFVSVRLANPAQPGTWLDPVRSEAGRNPGAFAVASFGPGRPGLAVLNAQVRPNANAVNTVSVLLADPAVAGGFLAPLPVALGTRNPTGVAAADLNGDGRADLVVAAEGGSDLLVYLQTTVTGSFQAAQSVPAGGQPTAAAIADLNQDGLPDLVAPLTGNTLAVLLQDPAHPGSFLPPVSYVVGTGPVCVQVADLDGDGRPDLVVANAGTALAATTQGLSVLRQDPAKPGSFLPAVTYDLGDVYAASVAVGDLNGDGRPDLAVANLGLPGWPGSVAVLLQDPARPGTFLPPTLYAGVAGPGSVAIGDLDGDGHPDLALADGGTVVRFQNAVAPGTFAGPTGFRR